MKFSLSRVAALAFCIFPLLIAIPAGAQLRSSLTDSLINRSLETVDLPSFEWTGAPEPLRPRVGVYLNELPPDTIKAMTHGAYTTKGFRVWHVMPHWPADDAGMLIGDILLTMNGKPIGDSVNNGEEYVGVVARDMKPNEIASFMMIRNGKVSELRVPVTAARQIAMPFTSPARLGPVRTNTWLQKAIEKNNLGEWSTTIRKQIRAITDQDFCTVPFAGRPNPWRLNAVTYLQHYPTRVGAYSRMIVQDLWDGVDAGPGLSGAVSASAHHLDIAVPVTPIPKLPTSIASLNEFLGGVQSRLDKAYGPERKNLDTITGQLLQVLSPDGGWEDAIDTTSDPAKKLATRTTVEMNMAALFKMADHIDLASLTDAARILASLADTTWLRNFSKTVAVPGKAIHTDGVEGDVIAVWDTPLGRCVIGGPGPNRYTGDFRFILDPGGNDIYELPHTHTGTFRYVADISGDDIYRNAISGQGSGIGCVDILVDLEGNDIYRAARYSQGAGLLGVGILADFSGDDIYTSQWCSQGAAFLGIGLLYEGSGSDSYTADMYSQAFGYAKGFGAILEKSGNDSYRAGWKFADPLARINHKSYISMSQGFGFGMRPWTTGIGTDGGIGALSDLDGDDMYASDFFSQGGSYWYALGILHDEHGSDRYTAGQYSQGSGIHLSFGALLDNAGDDSYDSYAYLDQGNAHDWSAGCLEDADGNDTYRAAGAGQGSALNVSFAWLLDFHGDDQYYTHLSDTTLSQGGGNFNRIRGNGSLGLLIDLGHGDDNYVEQRMIPGTAVVKGNKGMIYDDGVPVK
ncbi:MAG: hypothetical protein ABIR47_06020 [Candidatus Kapaibacterium sp.]